MTIEYLWIEKFKCFEKQGFNFGGENLFTIDISKLSANAITISSKKNPAYIKGFYNIPSAYQEAYITNVTALVGENGSGKTTLFDFFKVESLRSTKAKRQVIVVTHNANIVVNGDAENVITLHVHNGRTEIKSQGSLQCINVRISVCDVLEGGKEAFTRRYKRINIHQ